MAALNHYTGTLTDVGLDLIPQNFRLQVRPDREAFTDTGVLSSAPLPVTVDPLDGSFAFDVVASVDTTPNVKYVLEMLASLGGPNGAYYVLRNEWSFTARLGGGPIGEMAYEPVSRFIFSATAPGHAPGLIWVDQSDPYRWVFRDWS